MDFLHEQVLPSEEARRREASIPQYPDPEGPTMATFVPGDTLKDKLERIFLSPYAKLTSLNTISPPVTTSGFASGASYNEVEVWVPEGCTTSRQ